MWSVECEVSSVECTPTCTICAGSLSCPSFTGPSSRPIISALPAPHAANTQQPEAAMAGRVRVTWGR